MLKKFIKGIALSMVICMFISTSVFATEDVADVEINEEAIEAFIVDENGDKIPLEVEITVSPVMTLARNGGTTYALTATTGTDKTKSGSKNPTNSNIRVTATGTVYWTDNLGRDNILTAVSGGWTCLSGSSVSNTKIKYGTEGPGLGVYNYKHADVGTSFSKTGLSMHGQTMLLETTATAKNSNNKSEALVLTIKPGVLN